MTRFHQTTVLVTGAAIGIGAGVCTRFLAEGADVVATDLSEQGLELFKRTVPDEAQSRLHTLVMDVSKEESVNAALARIDAAHSHLDVVVNNAGVSALGAVGETTFEQWSQVQSVDLNSVFLVSRAALPLLQRVGGCIVNIASISGLFADHRMAAYNAAKGAVINLTRSLALDYGPRGVRTNAVAPGPVLTPALAAVAQDPSVLDAWLRGTPMGRLAEVDDVAGVVTFLASHDARHVNGVILPVDGGFTVKTGQPDLAAAFLGPS
jgi:meso-butanediol dehydrogenase/(S,S)-butanediol dehydrogenase/diacetyl reductase